MGSQSFLRNVLDMKSYIIPQFPCIEKKLKQIVCLSFIIIFLCESHAKRIILFQEKRLVLFLHSSLKVQVLPQNLFHVIIQTFVCLKPLHTEGIEASLSYPFAL